MKDWYISSQNKHFYIKLCEISGWRAGVIRVLESIPLPCICVINFPSWVWRIVGHCPSAAREKIVGTLFDKSVTRKIIITQDQAFEIEPMLALVFKDEDDDENNTQ